MKDKVETSPETYVEKERNKLYFKKIDKLVLSSDPGNELENCEDIAMGRENIQIPVYSKKEIRPPKLTYPRTNYKFTKYIPEKEFKSMYESPKYK